MTTFASFARATLCALAVYALVAQGFFACGTLPPAWLFLVALGAPLAVAVATRATRARTRPRTDVFDLASVFLVAVVFAALCYGAWATPSREWDGYVAWGLKAKVLFGDPVLREAFFSDPLVNAHSRDYPLLQPLCQASLAQIAGEAGGRLLFPWLWLVLAGLALRSALALGADSRMRSATWIGAALMPALVAPGGGAVDSGYAELFVTTALSGVACGMLTKDAVLVVAGTVVVALVKPEGPAYAGLVLLALAAAGLRARGRSKTALGIVAALGVASVIALLATRGRSLPYERLPDVLLGETTSLLVVRRYGFVWILLGVLAVLPRRVVGACPSPALGWLVIGGLLVAPAPFLLWPDVTVEHHLRSSMARLLLHWATPGWLLAMAWLARNGVDRAERRDELDTPRDRGASTMSA